MDSVLMDEMQVVASATPELSYNVLCFAHRALEGADAAANAGEKAMCAKIADLMAQVPVS